MSAQESPTRAWFRRVAGLVRKERLQIRRDASSYLIAGVMPLLLLFIYGYGVTLDLRRIPLALVIERSTPESATLLTSFRNSPYFDVVLTHHRANVEDRLIAGTVKGVVVLAADFSDRTERGEAAPIQVIVDGSDPNTAGLVFNYVQGVWANWLDQISIERRGTIAPRRTISAVVIEPRYWFNPDVRSQNFLIPGSVAIIMTLIGTLLTALVVAREWERGTIEALMATPMGRAEFLLGKLIPYYVLGMTAMAISVVTAVQVFHVPFRGSIPALLIVSSTFLIAMLSLGLLISTLTRNQFAASQVALLTAFLPAFELSGFIFEIDAMPLPIRTLTYFLPARYFVSSLQTLFLAGDVWSVLGPATLALAIIASVFLTLLVRSTRMRLE
ncbi:MAG TPA: ABC transporter permease [Pirellulales bacterium]|jgi:ABC-2 type transport system permease protein